MHSLSFRNLSLACALMFTAACGDNGGTTDTDSTAGTTTTNATPGTSTDPTPGTSTDPTATNPTTTEPTTTNPTTTEPTTTSPTTTDPTEDPTSGAGGNFCQEACTVDADCTAMGTDIGFKCNDGRCGGAASGCTDDAACQATVSGWVTTCASQADCMATMQQCVDIGGGAGRCATGPSDFLTCEQIMQSEVMLPAIEGGMDLTVCANTDFVCKDEVCQNPCEDNLECATFPGHPQCDVPSGKCECTSDDDCKNSGVAGFAACNEGTCGCAVDADCADAANADVCTKDGFCGCSDATVCTTKTFDGTMSVCEGA